MTTKSTRITERIASASSKETEPFPILLATDGIEKMILTTETTRSVTGPAHTGRRSTISRIVGTGRITSPMYHRNNVRNQNSFRS